MRLSCTASCRAWATSARETWRASSASRATRPPSEAPATASQPPSERPAPPSAPRCASHLLGLPSFDQTLTRAHPLLPRRSHPSRTTSASAGRSSSPPSAAWSASRSRTSSSRVSPPRCPALASSPPCRPLTLDFCAPTDKTADDLAKEDEDWRQYLVSQGWQGEMGDGSGELRRAEDVVIDTKLTF